MRTMHIRQQWQAPGWTRNNFSTRRSRPQAAAASQPLFAAGTCRVLWWMLGSQQAVQLLLLLLCWMQGAQQAVRLLLRRRRRRASSPATGWSSISWSVNCSSRRNSA